jgi:hypothetical protein
MISASNDDSEWALMMSPECVPAFSVNFKQVLIETRNRATEFSRSTLHDNHVLCLCQRSLSASAQSVPEISEFDQIYAPDEVRFSKSQIELDQWLSSLVEVRPLSVRNCGVHLLQSADQIHVVRDRIFHTELHTPIRMVLFFYLSSFSLTPSIISKENWIGKFFKASWRQLKSGDSDSSEPCIDNESFHEFTDTSPLSFNWLRSDVSNEHEFSFTLRERGVYQVVFQFSGDVIPCCPFIIRSVSEAISFFSTFISLHFVH